jgi:hypothetical protein
MVADEPAGEAPVEDVEGAVEEAAVPAAAQALRERFASHGIELADEVQLAEVPGHVLDALLEAMPTPPGPRPTEDERRQELSHRIASSQRLPRGVRERLARAIGAVRFDDMGRDEPVLRVSDAVALLEESLPPHLLLAPDDVDAATHPRGEAFFTGDVRAMSDDDARRIAAEQLARTGYRRTA